MTFSSICGAGRAGLAAFCEIGGVGIEPALQPLFKADAGLGREKSPIFVSAGMGKSGSTFLPSSSCRLQRRAISTLFSSASGTSANNSAISAVSADIAGRYGGVAGADRPASRLHGCIPESRAPSKSLALEKTKPRWSPPPAFRSPPPDPGPLRDILPPVARVAAQIKAFGEKLPPLASQFGLLRPVVQQRFGPARPSRPPDRAIKPAVLLASQR